MTDDSDPAVAPGSPPGSPPAVVGPGEVEHVATLARLRVDPSEIPGLVQHFERMLEFVAELEALVASDVGDLSAAASVSLSSSILREDALRPDSDAGGPLATEEVLSRAPAHAEGLITTPRVV